MCCCAIAATLSSTVAPGSCGGTKPKNRRPSLHAGATVTGNLSQIKTKAKLSPEVSQKG